MLYSLITGILSIYAHSTKRLIFVIGLLQNKWAEMFECIVAVASTLEVISNGSDGSRNGSILLVCYSRTIKIIYFGDIC